MDNLPQKKSVKEIPLKKENNFNPKIVTNKTSEVKPTKPSINKTVNAPQKKSINQTIQKKQLPTQTKKEPEKPQPTITYGSVDKKKIKYNFIGKIPLSKWIAQNIPKELIPTNRTGYILGIVYMVVVILALAQFPLGSFLSGNLDVEVTAGIPWKFLKFDLEDPTKSPILIKGFVLDLILYLIISYIIEIIINIILGLDYFKTKKELSMKPRTFKDPTRKSKAQETIADKLTKTGVRKKAPGRQVLKKDNRPRSHIARKV